MVTVLSWICFSREDKAGVVEDVEGSSGCSLMTPSADRAALGGAWPPKQESYHHPPHLNTGVATSGLGVGLSSLEE
ncbi:hypothetical protein QYF61_003972 [Mycteria americana]|uniref:Uncharacterized protein n=1 Tax=Mycteria americana TaxID=33587 RepID=A0AAN7RG62_MYCAM|nr:hypothetical protein QYF61_003972 [Mycteria americana]